MPARLLPCGQQAFRFAACQGMATTMEIGPYRIELDRLTESITQAGIDRVRHLLAGLGVWFPVRRSRQPGQERTGAAVDGRRGTGAQVPPRPAIAREATSTASLRSRPMEPAPVDGLKISSQSWRRGGLGSNAQVTFTLRNGNDYAVRDIEISCAFTRRDGSHLTDRTRMIHDIVNMKSR